MFFLLPYRVKNPWKQFPYATVSIIGLNVLVYLFTTQYLLVINESVLNNYGCSPGATPVYTLFTSMFLHADIMHLAGNMLFLWVFGPPVEDRLGPWLYLLVYFAAGSVGTFAHAMLGASLSAKPVPVIGASGCISGVLGAYWYMYSWSKVCVAYLVWLFIVYVRAGIWEVEAAYIIGLFFLMDVLQGMLGRMAADSGGVANFAHVGGLIAGALFCLALGVKRDTEYVSEAKAMQSDIKDLSMMPLHALLTMLEEDPCNPEILRAMVRPAASLNQLDVLKKAVAAAGAELIDRDPKFVAYYLLDLRGDPRIYQSFHLLRLAGELERLGSPEQAIAIYKMIVSMYPGSADCEAALFRMAQCYWRYWRDAVSAKNCLRDLASQFPNGTMTPYGRMLWNEISAQSQH